MQVQNASVSEKNLSHPIHVVTGFGPDAATGAYGLHGIDVTTKAGFQSRLFSPFGAFSHTMRDNALSQRAFPSRIYAMNAWDVTRAQGVSKTLANFSRIGYQYNSKNASWSMRPEDSSGAQNSSGANNMARAMGARIDDIYPEPFRALTPDERKDEDRYVDEMLAWGNPETYDSIQLHNKIDFLKTTWLRQSHLLGEALVKGRENKWDSMGMLVDCMGDLLQKRFTPKLKKSLEQKLQTLYQSKAGRPLTAADLLTVIEQALIKAKCPDSQTILRLAGYYVSRYDAWAGDKGGVLSQDQAPNETESFFIFDWQSGGQVAVDREKKIAHEVYKDLETKTLFTALEPYEQALAKSMDETGGAEITHFHGNNYNAGINGMLPKENSRLWTTLMCLKWMGDQPHLYGAALKVPSLMTGPCGALQQPAWLLGGALTAVRHISGTTHMFDHHCRDHQDVEDGTFMFVPKGTALYDHLEKEQLHNEYLAPTHDDPHNRVVPEKITRTNQITGLEEEGLVVPVDCVHTQAFAYIEGTEREMSRNLRRMWDYHRDAKVVVSGVSCNPSGQDEPYVFGGDGEHLFCETKDFPQQIPFKISSQSTNNQPFGQEALIIEALELYQQHPDGSEKLVGGFTQNHDDASHPKGANFIANENQPCQDDAEHCVAGNRNLYLGIFKKSLAANEQVLHAESTTACEHEHPHEHDLSHSIVAFAAKLADQYKNVLLQVAFLRKQWPENSLGRDHFETTIKESLDGVGNDFEDKIRAYFLDDSQIDDRETERPFFSLDKKPIDCLLDSASSGSLLEVIQSAESFYRNEAEAFYRKELDINMIASRPFARSLDRPVPDPKVFYQLYADQLSAIDRLCTHSALLKTVEETLDHLSAEGFSTKEILENCARQSRELEPTEEKSLAHPARDQRNFVSASNLLKVALSASGDLTTPQGMDAVLADIASLAPASLSGVKSEISAIASRMMHGDLAVNEAAAMTQQESAEEPDVVPQNRRDPQRGWHNTKSSFMVPPMIKGVVSSGTFLGGASYLASAIAGASQAVLWFGTAASGASAGLAGLLGWIGIEKIRDASHSDRRLNQVDKSLIKDQRRLRVVQQSAQLAYQSKLDELQSLSELDDGVASIKSLIGEPHKSPLILMTMKESDFTSPLEPFEIESDGEPNELVKSFPVNELNRFYHSLNKEHELVRFLEENKQLFSKEYGVLSKLKNQCVVLTSFTSLITPQGGHRNLQVMNPSQLYSHLEPLAELLSKLQLVGAPVAENLIDGVNSLKREVQQLTHLHRAAEVSSKHLETVKNHRISIAKEREENQVSRRAATGYIGSAGLLGAGSGLGIASHFVSAGSAIASGFALASSWASGVGLVALTLSYGVNWSNKSKEHQRLTQVMRVAKGVDPNTNEPFLPTVVGMHHSFLQHLNDRMVAAKREKNLWRAGTVALGALSVAGIAAAGLASGGVIPAVALIAFAVVTLVGSVPLLTSTFQLFNRYSNWGGQFARRNEDSVDIDDTLIDSSEDRKKLFWIKNGGMFNLMNEKVVEIAQTLGDEARASGEKGDGIDIIHNRKPYPLKASSLLTLPQAESRKEVAENLKARGRWIYDQTVNPNVGEAKLAKELALKLDQVGQTDALSSVPGKLTGGINDYLTHRLNFLQHRKGRLESILQSLEVAFQSSGVPSPEQKIYYGQIKAKYQESEGQRHAINRYLKDLSQLQVKTHNMTKMGQADAADWQKLQLRFMALTGAFQHMLTRKEQKALKPLTEQGGALDGIMKITTYRANMGEHVASCKVLDDVAFANCVMGQVSAGGDALRRYLSPSRLSPTKAATQPSQLSQRFADYFVSVLPNVEFGDIVSLFERYELNNRMKPEANVNNQGKPYLASQ